jgi:hypothetical protein
MANGTTAAIVLKVACGQVLNTTINGVAVQIDCQGGGSAWTPPDPPSGAGGVVAFAQIPANAQLLDLGAVVTAFRDDQLHQHAVTLGPDESATVVLEGPGGSRASLDTMMTKPDA